jgi:hypothetical protein
MLYRKKPQIYKAVQWKETEESFEEIKEIIPNPEDCVWIKKHKNGYTLTVFAIDGTNYAKKDFWVVVREDKVVYVFPPEQFEFIFEKHE